MSVATVSAAVVDQIRHDPEFAALVARQLRPETPTFLRSLEELIANDEDDAVEFKSTARWDIRAEKRNPAIEDAIVKTAAAFLNTNGGTLLIGVANDRSLVGLELDYPHVRPANADGFVNWLTTHLLNALDSASVMRMRARVVTHVGAEICRLDVAPSSRPVWAKTSKAPRVFYVRMNNSTRVLPESEFPAYAADRWPSGAELSR